MNPAQLKHQALADQAREQLADTVTRLQNECPAFLLAVCEAIDQEQDLAAQDDRSSVQMPVLTFRIIAQFAKVGVADIEGVLRRRDEDK